MLASVRRRLHTLYQNTILEPIDNWLLLINLANGGMKAFKQRKGLGVQSFITNKFMHFTAFAIYWMIHLKLQFEPFYDAYYSSDSASFHVRPAR